MIFSSCTELGLREQRHLLLEQLVRPGPDGRRLPVLELQQARQEGGAKGLAGLAREQAGQVVDGDDAQGRAGLGVDGDDGVGKGRVDGVDGDGVVRVGGVAGDVADDAEVARGRGQALLGDERRDGVGEVDAVDKDLLMRQSPLFVRVMNTHVALDNLRVRPRLLPRLVDVPLHYILLLHTRLEQAVHCSATASAQSAHDEAPR